MSAVFIQDSYALILNNKSEANRQQRKRKRKQRKTAALLCDKKLQQRAIGI